MQNYFEATPSFFVSFTTDSPHEIELHKTGCDRLSQWRRYALGKQGYCLGFDNASIKEIGNHLHEINHLAGLLKPCMYDEEQKIKLAQESIEPVFEIYAKAVKNAPPTCTSIQPFKDANGKAMQAFKASNNQAIFMYSLMKHASFEEEHETRLSAIFVNGVSDSNLIQYRNWKNGQVPYIEIPIGIRRPISTLKKIVVGPSEQKEQQAAVLRFRLQQMGLSKVEVIPSNIPYRNW